jgi:hypothetical protein
MATPVIQSSKGIRCDSFPRLHLYCLKSVWCCLDDGVYFVTFFVAQEIEGWFLADWRGPVIVKIGNPTNRSRAAEAAMRLMDCGGQRRFFHD